MTGLAIRGAAYARMNWDAWIVDCPRPYCRSALGLCEDSVDQWGRIRRGLTWGQTWMQCWDCDFVADPVIWPADGEAIDMLLRHRPDVSTRNWHPGETLDDLFVENVAHGILPRGLELDGPSTSVMEVIDGRLVGGLLLNALPSADSRRLEIAAR